MKKVLATLLLFVFSTSQVFAVAKYGYSPPRRANAHIHQIHYRPSTTVVITDRYQPVRYVERTEVIYVDRRESSGAGQAFVLGGAAVLMGAGLAAIIRGF